MGNQMFYYKDQSDRVHVLDSDEFEYLLPTGCERISKEEADRISALIANPPLTVLQQIEALEATATPRRLREAALGTDAGWLANLDAQIAALRAQLDTEG